jgi:phospholipase C
VANPKLPQNKIAHVVVLMMENRSFDHIFGFRAGVEGLKGDEFNLLDPGKPEGVGNPAFHVGTGAPYAITVGQGPGHSVNQTTTQLFGNKTASGKPLNNGFVKSYHTELTVADKVPSPSQADLGVCMQSFEAARLPALNALADEFCICDHWFSEVPGPTQPNRLYLHAATSDGHGLNAWSLHFDLKTIYQQVQEAGLSWATYEHDTNEVRWFTPLQPYKDNFKSIDQFAADCKAGTLAHYNFIVPRMLSNKGGMVNDQHAPNDVRYGDILIADVYKALRANDSVWKQSLLIVTYDEHGGFYDHVAPPKAPNPDGKTSPTSGDPDYAPSFAFDRLGLRVPAVIASPWVPKGTVYTKPLQHTSVMQTARKLFGISGTLTKRDASAASFDDVLSLSSPRNDAPADLPRPDLAQVPPASSPDHPANQPLDPIQHGIVLGVHHNTHASHPDGVPAELVPVTQGKASQFIKQRTAQHFKAIAKAPQPAAIAPAKAAGAGKKAKARRK